MQPEPGASLSRRAFLERAGLLGAAAALAQLPGLLGPRGLIAQAEAIELDVVRDTVNGMLAFALPGSDEYSVAQGVTAPGAGGVASGAADALILTLDRLLAAASLGPSGVTVPLSAAVATLLNSFALQVSPAAASGLFLSPFARLTFREKGEALRRLEAEAALSEVIEPIRFVGGVFQGLAAFMAFGEAGVYDARSRTLRSRPIGWEISGYGGPVDGHPGFRGYYRKHTAAVRTRRRRTPRRR